MHNAVTIASEPTTARLPFTQCVLSGDDVPSGLIADVAAHNEAIAAGLFSLCSDEV